MENINFSKPEDQKKFAGLSEEEKNKIVDVAHDEAIELNKAEDSDVVDMKIEYPVKWVDNEGLVHGAKSEEEAIKQKQEYRESKER